MDNITPEEVVFTIYQLALYGGLDLQNTLYEKKIIPTANQDKIFIEGVAYMWANLHLSIITDAELAIYNDTTIIQGMEVGGGVLAELLSKHSTIELDKNFVAFYQAANFQKADEILIGKLLTINGLDNGDLLENQVSVGMIATIYSSTIKDGLIGTAKNVIESYLNQ